MSNVAGGTIVWDLEANTSQLESGLKDASRMVNNTADSLDKTFKSFGNKVSNLGKDMSIAITAPITAIGTVAFKFTELAGRYSSVEDAFKSMTKGMGIDAKKFQKDVADATGGQIDNLTILQGATRGLSLIGKDAFNNFGQDFVKMAELSKKAARATGQDVDFMFNSLILGISRESKLILDNLGISIDITKAKADYADQLGKTSEELTMSEQKHAVLNATLGQLESTYGAVAISAGGFQGAFQQLGTVITNAQLQIGKELEPSLAELTKSLTELAKDIIPQVVAVVKDVIKWWTSLDKETQKNIITFIALAATLGPVLIVIGSFISAIGGIVGAVITLISFIGKLGFIFQALGVIWGVIQVAAVAVGTFIAGITAPVWIAIGAITALIAIGVLLWKNWDVVSAKVREWANILIQNIRFVLDAFQSLPGRIWNAMSSVFDAITKPFRDAWNTIQNIVRRIREELDRINPFHRESPSLVDNVTAGVREIQKQYARLQSIEMPAISTQSMPYSNMDSGGFDSGETINKKDIVVNIGEVNNTQDIEMISREIGYRFSLI